MTLKRSGALLLAFIFAILLSTEAFAMTKYERAKVLYTYLRGKGFTKVGTCAVIGNCDIEAGISPVAQSPYGYLGICQWGGGRKQRLLKHWKKPKTLKTQKKYFYWECKKHYYSAFKKIKNAKKWTRAMDGVAKYEGSRHGYHQKIKRAKYWLGRLG